MNNMHAKKAKRKINIAILALILFSAICISACGVNIAKRQDIKTAKVEGRQQITNDLIELLEADPELKELMQESIHSASVNNPDKKTNPVQSLDDYYDFLDWSATCMPWNILEGQDDPNLYTMKRLSVRTYEFTDSVIRRMTGFTKNVRRLKYG